MNSFIPEGSILIRSLGWTLMHSLWQGALIAACLWVLLKLLHNIPARLKYHLCLSSLAVMASWFIITWIQQWQRLQAITVFVTAASRDTGLEKSYTISSLPAEGSTDIWLRHLMPNMEHAFPVLVMIYTVGLAFMLLRFGLGFGKLLQTRYSGITPPDAYWQQRLLELKDKLIITQKVKLFYSSRINMPMMLGILKPVILLPFATISQLPTDQIEAILLHELAHIKRNDYLVNIFQIVAETMLFFNPFMWWISAGIRREREHCCDDLVLAQTQQPLPYAIALAALEAFRNNSQPFTLAAGGQKHNLFNRIKRITEMKKNPLNYGRLAAALLIVGGITFSVIWFTPALAQARKEKAASKTVTTQRIVIIDDKGNRKEYNSVDELPETEKANLKKSLLGFNARNEDYNEGETTNDVIAPEPPEPPTPPAEGFAPMAPIAPIPPIPPMPVGIDRETRKALEEANKAIAAIDWKAIDKTTQAALRNADKAIAQANESLKNIDWKAIDVQIDKAMTQLDDVDWDEVATAEGNARSGREIRKEVKMQIADARRAAHDQRAMAMEARKDAHEEALDARRDEIEARKDAANAKREVVLERRYQANAERIQHKRESSFMMKNYNKMIKEMVQDGLLESENDVNINKNPNDLYINGKKQSDEVKVKYRHYFPPGKVKIKTGKYTQGQTFTYDLSQVEPKVEE